MHRGLEGTFEQHFGMHSGLETDSSSFIVFERFRLNRTDSSSLIVFAPGGPNRFLEFHRLRMFARRAGRAEPISRVYRLRARGAEPIPRVLSSVRVCEAGRPARRDEASEATETLNIYIYIYILMGTRA